MSVQEQAMSSFELLQYACTSSKRAPGHWGKAWTHERVHGAQWDSISQSGSFLVCRRCLYRPEIDTRALQCCEVIASPRSPTHLTWSPRMKTQSRPWKNWGSRFSTFYSYNVSMLQCLFFPARIFRCCGYYFKRPHGPRKKKRLSWYTDF